MKRWVAGFLIIIIFFIIAVTLLHFTSNPKQNNPTTAIPSSQRSQDKSIKIYDSDGNVRGDIKLNSTLPGYELEFTDKSAFLTTLSDWNIFRTAFSNIFGNSKGEVKTVSITLADKPQKMFIENDSNNNQITSANLSLKDGEIDVVVYVAPSQLAKNSSIFEEKVLSTIFFMKYYAPTGKNDVDTKQYSLVKDAFQKYLSQKKSGGKSFLAVVKK